MLKKMIKVLLEPQQQEQQQQRRDKEKRQKSVDLAITSFGKRLEREISPKSIWRSTKSRRPW